VSNARKQAVQAQFGRQAQCYTTSHVHRASAGLPELIRLAAPVPGARALDIATGTGFTALALSPQCRRVIGLDLTLGMLNEARRLAGERGAPNLLFSLGDAEAVPFRDNTFDIVTCRFASHHFPDLPRAFSEMARVATPGGRVVLEDTCAPEDPALATLMNEWEVKRDPSHAANHPPTRLRAMLHDSGLTVQAVIAAHVPQAFSDWVRRGGVLPSTVAALRASFLGAPAEARAAFRIETANGDIHFAWPEIIILGIKPQPPEARITVPDACGEALP
jgi:ubiquinone/menaquinone biosynthesis C-methylase UbiE